MKDRDSCLVELQRIATNAQRAQQVWWALVNRLLPAHGETMNLYADFFITTRDACLVAMVVETYRLIDERSDVNSLRTFMNRWGDSFSEEKRDFELALSRHHETIKSLVILRHNVFAHQTSKLTEEQVFLKAALAPNNLRDLLEDLLAIMRKLLTNCGTGSGNISESSRYGNAAVALVTHIEIWQRQFPQDNRKIF